MSKRGIDISAHNDNINLSALKSQIDFVIIRVGYGTKGTIDKKFKRNADLCVTLGIPYGFYWYSYALNVNDASKEADAFLKAIAPYNPTIGCWFDMEDADGYKKKNGMPSNQMLKDICYKFCETVENAGYYTGIYASQSWFNNQLAGDRLSRFDKWVAQWPTSGGKQKGLSVNADSKSGVSLWQFTSEGRFSGYDGVLDTNYAYKTFPNPKSHGTDPQPAPSTEPVQPVQSTHSINEVVKINGIYTSSDSNEKLNPAKDQGTITKIIEGTKNPYLLDNGDLGWTNDNCIIGSGEIKPAKTQIRKGSKIKFTGTKSYSGIKLADWTHNYVFNVIEVSGERVVIGKGTAVTAAVNIKDCQPV